MTLSLTPDQVRRLRFRANLLLSDEDAGQPLPAFGVASAVVGVQAQELPAGKLSIWARSPGLTDREVEAARLVDRSLVRTWLMRGTLHLVTAEDAAWLVPFLGPTSIASHRRRFEELGWSGEKAQLAMHTIGEALEEQGNLTRAEIARLLQSRSLPYEGQATIHLIYHLALEGRLCCGPERDKEPTYVLLEEWVGPLRPLPRQDALATLARRYLAAFAPAAPKDLSAWSGLGMAEARQAWDLISDRLERVEIDRQPAWMLKSQLAWLNEDLRSAPLVRLLPRFDTYLLGWANRDFALDHGYTKRVHPGGGILHATLAVDGRILGTWKTRSRRAGQTVVVEPFQKLPTEVLPPLHAQAAALGRFLDVETTLEVLEPGNG